MKRVSVYTFGLCYASACAEKDVPRDEVEAAVNGQCPTGISSRWAISSEPTFKDGQPNPCQCEQDHNRQHWLLSC
jgi:hypothetical protein